MKKHLALKFTACLLTLALLPFASATEKEAPIKLGVISPLSGDFANYGKFVQDGVTLALEDSPVKNVQVSYEDACLPKGAVDSYKKLAQRDKVQAIVGSYCVIGLNAFAKLADRNKTIVFHSSPIPKGILDMSPYIFSTNVRIKDEAERLAEYAAKELKAKTVLIEVFDSPWGNGFAVPFQAKFEALGGTVVGLELPPIGETDFRPMLTKYRSKQPDLLFIVDIANRTGTIMKQARQLGITSRFLSVDEIEEPQVLEVAGKAAEGTVFFAPETKTPSSLQTDFQARFKKSYGYTPTSLSSSSYDATILTLNALNECKGSRECAKDFLHKITLHSGASGTITIDSDGGTKKEFVRKIVKDGQFVRDEPSLLNN